MTELALSLLRGPQDFCADRRGSAGVIAALAAPALLGFAALAIDVGSWYYAKQQVQTAADAAAYSGAMLLARGVPDAAHIQQVATGDAARNGASAGRGDLIRVNVNTSSRSVEVNVSRTAPVFFSGVLGFAQPVLHGRALAKSLQGLKVCVLALDPTASPAISVEGSSKMNAEDCVIYANSSANNAVTLKPAAWMTAQKICTAGTSSGSNFNPRPEAGCAPLADPLASLPPPPFSGCDYTNYSAPRGYTTIGPGVYCGGLTAASGADVALEPGIYIMRDGPVRFGGNTSLSGDGVTLFLTGSARIDFNGGPTLNLSAPKTGTYAGVAIYGDRAQAELAHTFQGSGGAMIDGAVYVPNGVLTYAGSSAAAITVAIAKRFTISGSSGFQRNTAATPVPLPPGFSGAGIGSGRVALVE